MKRCQLLPVEESHSNGSLKGYGDIPDLAVTNVIYSTGERAVLSVWKFPSFLSRIKFLFDGRIGVSVLGDTHPPLSVTAGDSGI